MVKRLDNWAPIPQQPQKATISDGYAKFQAKYRNDPVGFARDCIKWAAGDGLAPYQEDIMRGLIEHRRVAAVGPHGLGKTTTMALIVHWFALTRDGEDWKLPMTASVWRQLTEFLCPEIHKWARRIRWDVVGRSPYTEGAELLDLSLNLRTGSAFALASDKPSALEGAHADCILYVFDESKAVETATFNAAEGAFSTPGEVMALAVSTPGDNVGRFWEIHSFRDRFAAWWVRAVTLDECIAAGRITREWAEQRKLEWGEDNPEYIRRVLGRFAMADAADGVIPRRWVVLAQARWHVITQQIKEQKRGVDGVSGYAVDVGGENPDGDSTVIATRRGTFVEPLEPMKALDPMRIASVMLGKYAQDRAKFRVDKVGIGAGVVARARTLGIPVDDFGAGESAAGLTDSTKLLKFLNKRAWGWWRLREMLDPLSGANIALPPDQELADELCAPVWFTNAADKVVVEDKKKVKERIGRSTDRADAVMMLFADAPATSKQPREEPRSLSIPSG